MQLAIARVKFLNVNHAYGQSAHRNYRPVNF